MRAASEPVQRVLDALTSRDCRVARNGSGWQCQCPSHEDRAPSLSISEGDDGRALLHCHANCVVDEIVGALGLTRADLFERERRRIVERYAYSDEHARLLYEVVRFEPKDFRQRRPSNGAWTWNLRGVRRVLFRLPSVLAAASAGERVYVCEGEKDVEAIVAAGCVATCNAGGAGKWRDEYSRCLRGARVVIVADRDEPGLAHARQVAASCRAASVDVLGMVQAVEGKDAADHLAAGHALSELAPVEEVETTGEDSTPAEHDSRPLVMVTDRPLDAISADALAALRGANDPPSLFVRGGKLARICRDERSRPFIEHETEASLRGRLARAASFTAIRERGAELVSPPLDAVRDVAALGEWPFPPLAGIVEAPALRPDGTVLDDPGYDPTTKLVYAPAPGLRVPAIPAQPDARELAAAVALVDEALVDFPFVDGSSRANAIALLLTPILRPAISGLVPLGLLDATKAGTGKGLLAGVGAVIATGQGAAAMTAPVREEEWEKRIFAQVLRGASFVLIDEARDLGSPALSAVLTAASYEGRVLGKSEIASLPNRIVWCAAGNNVKLRGDMPRRCYWIRLDAQSSRPWQRTRFRHPDLLAWVSARRGDLLAALLTMARAWYAAGRPAADVPALGSFGEWTRVVGGVLAHASVEGFLGNTAALYDAADEEGSEWEAFLAALLERFPGGFMAGDVASALDELRDVLPGALADKTEGKGFRRALGRAFGAKDGTRFGEEELYLTKAGEDARNKTTRWRVARGRADVAEVREPAIARLCAPPHAHARESDARKPVKKTHVIADASGHARARAQAHGTVAHTSATSALPQDGGRLADVEQNPAQADALLARVQALHDEHSRDAGSEPAHGLSDDELVECIRAGEQAEQATR